ncbi:MAG: PqqD family peptide modification chaperone [Ilumatobacteraceae bacterium]
MISDRPCVLERLEVSEAKDGLIVYDTTSDRVHHLNATAAVVFALCDGDHDVASIAAVVAAAFELDSSPVAEVERCLRELSAQGLLA